ACLNTMPPGSSKVTLSTIPALGFPIRPASVRLRSSSGVLRRSRPLNSRRSKAHSATTRSSALAQEFERGEPVIRIGDGLAVHQARARLERAQGLHDQREASRPVDPIAGEQPHANGVAPSHEAEAVVFDLVNPAGTARGVLGGGWEAGRNEGGRGPAGTQQHAGGCSWRTACKPISH